MKKIIRSLLLPASVMLASCVGSTQQQEEGFNYIDERFADIQMLRYNVEGFDALSLQQKTFVYYLQEAALWGRDILFDQNGRYNLEIRRMMEKLYQEYDGDRECADFKAFEVYRSACGSATAYIITTAARSSLLNSAENGSWPKPHVPMK